MSEQGQKISAFDINSTGNYIKRELSLMTSNNIIMCDLNLTSPPSVLFLLQPLSKSRKDCGYHFAS